MAAVLDYDVEGRCHKARIPPRSSCEPHVTSEYAAIGEGDHAEIVDSGKYLATSAMMVPWWPRAGLFYRLHHEFQS
jgi:hypothetical protein